MLKDLPLELTTPGCLLYPFLFNTVLDTVTRDLKMGRKYIYIYVNFGKK